MLENVPLSNGIHDVVEFKYIIDNVPSLLVHLDIPHAFTSGGMKSVLDYINRFRDKIIHIHWHDNHGRKDEHLPIGEGLIEHEKAVRALKDIDYDRTITLEVFTNSNDAKSSTDKLKTLWVSEFLCHLLKKTVINTINVSFLFILIGNGLGDLR